MKQYKTTSLYCSLNTRMLVAEGKGGQRGKYID